MSETETTTACGHPLLIGVRGIVTECTGCGAWLTWDGAAWVPCVVLDAATAATAASVCEWAADYVDGDGPDDSPNLAAQYRAAAAALREGGR